MTRRSLWMLGILSLALCAGVVRSEDTPPNVDQTLTPDMDAGINSSSSDNHGTADEFQSGFYSDGTKGKPVEYRILMHFDLSTLRKTPVRCAILRICNKNNTRGKDEKFIRVQALYRPWKEKEATWYTNEKGDGWVTDGGDFLQKCYGAASIPPRWGGEEEHYYSFDITQLVQLWQVGQITNDGLIIMNDAGSDNYQRYHSREYTNGNRPELWISYTGTITSSDPTVMDPSGIPAIGPAPDLNPHITTKDLNAGHTGQPFSVQLTAKGGNRPYVWSLPIGSKLPDGFTLSADGLLSGTAPAPVMKFFRVKCTDKSKKYDMVSLKLVIQGQAVGAPAPTDTKKPAPKPTPGGTPALPNDDG
ncbi:MAG: DNRLRE domain-containing protein [Planctomycetota bacterium]